jgi:hypothetical protein
MFAIRVLASVILLAGGLWATFRPVSPLERRVSVSGRPKVSILYLRLGILPGTAALIALVWL